MALALIAWWLPFDELWSAIRSVPASAVARSRSPPISRRHLLGVVKWRLLVNTAGAGLPGRTAVHAYYWGLFGNLFLPSIVGGDVVRAGVAMQHVALEERAGAREPRRPRAGRRSGSAFIAGIGALLAPRALDDASRRVFIAVLVVIGVATIAGLLALRFFPVRLVPYKARRLLVRVRQAVRSTAARPQALVRGIHA